MLYKKNGAVSCAGSDFSSDLAQTTPVIDTVRWKLFLDIKFDSVWSLADINRNCNTFFGENWYSGEFSEQPIFMQKMHTTA